tara:strand:- start:250 stop:504 length:255 start_codon:yes stop_codon:yes gene_type:complete
MTVLFVCIWKIYRTRFAEEVFNYPAKKNNSKHLAFSAGFKIGDYNFRTIYFPALDNLKNLIPFHFVQMISQSTLMMLTFQNMIK